MYWDTLTAAGFFVSIVLIFLAFYLELRNRPEAPRGDLRQA